MKLYQITKKEHFLIHIHCKYMIGTKCDVKESGIFKHFVLVYGSNTVRLVTN